LLPIVNVLLSCSSSLLLWWQFLVLLVLYFVSRIMMKKMDGYLLFVFSISFLFERNFWLNFDACSPYLAPRNFSLTDRNETKEGTIVICCSRAF
jgi:hypothetical protein